MNNFVDWKSGDPELEGLYLVAIRYPNGLGELDILFWRGSWYTLYDKESIPENYKIVGHITTTGVVRSFKGSWPEWDSEK